MSFSNGDYSSAESGVAANWSLVSDSVNVNGRTTPALVPEDGSSGRLSPMPERASKLDARSDETEILDLITKLQQLGIQDHYDMPQIIVCGSQSSGKSSVLAAITGIPFPKARETCTKFVTQVTLQRRDQPGDTVNVTIKPEPSSNESRKARLRGFHEYADGSDCLTKLSDILKKAKDLIFQDADKDRLVTKDIVQVTISGPKKRPLQLFDLPGLMGVDVKKEMKDVEDIVRQYMNMPQSIILGVVKASGDVNGADSAVLGWAKNDYDPDGKRTIGVVTHPDRSGSEEEQWIRILQGHPNRYGLNNQWHVLRNPAESEDIDPDQRDVWERNCFESSPWREVPENLRGAGALFDRLCNSLFSRLRERLPGLRAHLHKSLTEIEANLGKLGDTSATERVRVFRQRLEGLRKAARDHAEGFYNYDISDAFTSETEAYLRARVVEKGEQLRDSIIADGHAWESHFAPTDLGPDTDLKSLGKSKDLSPKSSTRSISYASREEEVRYWAKRLVQTRGRELPGHTDPAQVSRIFWEMSRPWYSIAEEQVKEILDCCEEYLRKMALHHFRVISRVRGSTGFSNAEAVARRYVDDHVMKKLGDRGLNALEELERLEEDRRDRPINYDFAFLAEQRNYNCQQLFQSTMKAINVQEGQQKVKGASPESLESRKFAQDAGRFSQEEQNYNETARLLHDANRHYTVSKPFYVYLPPSASAVER